MKLIATLPGASLRAAMFFSAKQDVRYYLNGVRIEHTASGEVYVVATDGSAIFAHRETKAEMVRPGPWAITVAATSLAALVKTNPTLVQLFETDEGFAVADGLGAVFAFKPVEGVYPDWRRVVPRKSSVSGEAGLYSTDYLTRAGKALAIVDGLSGKAAAYHGELHQNGSAPGVAVGKTQNTVIVISPRRITKKNPMATDWFTPLSFAETASVPFDDLA